MTSIAFAPGARNDLIDIWSYTFDHWGIAQADAYTADIHAALHAAADQSPKAQSINMVRAGYWRIRAGSHICYFTKADKDIIVMRILHERMDAASLL
jgi:toxin ParE1/3/4